MEARLRFLGHTLMENRSGLIVDACLTAAGGHAELPADLADAILEDLNQLRAPAIAEDGDTIIG